MQRPSDKLYWDNKWAGTLVAPQGTLVMYLEYCLAEPRIHPPLLSSLPSQPSPRSSSLSADAWCHFLPTWHGSCIRMQSSSHSYTILPPAHHRSLPEKCWVTDQNLANVPVLLILSSSFFFLHETAKFRLTAELSHSNFWCILSSHGPCHCLGPRLKVITGVVWVGHWKKNTGHICSGGI